MKVVNPTIESEVSVTSAAPRLSTLSSKKIIKKPETEVMVISGNSNAEALREVNGCFYEEKWSIHLPR